MLMSMFSSFDALSAETFGQKVGFSGRASSSKEGKVVDAAPASKVAPSRLTNESVNKCKVGNSSEPQAADGRKQKTQLRKTRFAPEFDGVFCFETIVPY